MIKICKTHGETEFTEMIGGRNRTYYARCKLCRHEQVKKSRLKAKATLIFEHGGKCQICGYDKYQGALEFHHRDPTTKSFAVAAKPHKSLEALRKEAAKCDLVCSNCHKELEAGLIRWPEATR